MKQNGENKTNKKIKWIACFYVQITRSSSPAEVLLSWHTAVLLGLHKSCPDVWREIVSSVDWRGLYWFVHIIFSTQQQFQRIYLLLYRYSLWSCRKHCRETRLSCSLFLKMKTLLSYRCCCLGNLVTLTLLSTLFTTRFIKCIAAGN